jgi:hypothetical protein
VLCPHCSADTPATSPYCQVCGKPVDLTFDKVQESFEEEASVKAVRDTEARCRTWLLAAVSVLVVAIAARLLLVPQPEAPYVLPAYIVGAPVGEEKAAAIEPLPLEVPVIEVPNK